MHSVLVFGDLRYHQLTDGATREPLFPAVGGAGIMWLAIRQVIDLMAKEHGSGVSLFPDSFPGSPNSTSTEDTFFRTVPLRSKLPGGVIWGAEDHSASRVAQRIRLLNYESENPDKNSKPVITQAGLGNLWTTLLDGEFDKTGSVPHDSVPDIVVIDDLGLGVGDLEIDFDDGQMFEAIPKLCTSSPRKFTSDGGPIDIGGIVNTIESSLEREYSVTGQSEKEGEASEARAIADAEQGIVLAMLLRRLQFAAGHICNHPEEDSIEPILLLSASGFDLDTEYLPEISNKKNLWWHVHQNSELCKRTVAMLNVRDVRGSAPISTNLSWERTAQDTLFEFERNEKLKPFLKFGHVIVRFGLTGALLISNSESSGQRCTLFFDPEKSDADWSNPEKDKVVLGDSSIFMATLVETLAEKCRGRRGKTSLGDLGSVLGHAIPTAITRLQKHYCLGHDFAIKASDEEQEQCLHFDPAVFDDSLLAGTTDALPNDRVQKRKIVATACHSIQKVPVTRAKSRSWSILTESVQTQRDKVARNIILYGTRSVLNTAANPESRVLKILLENILTAFKLTSIDSSLKEFVQCLTQESNREELFKKAVEATHSNIQKDRSCLSVRAKEKLSGLPKEIGNLASHTRGIEKIPQEIGKLRLELLSIVTNLKAVRDEKWSKLAVKAAKREMKKKLKNLTVEHSPSDLLKTFREVQKSIRFPSPGIKRWSYSAISDLVDSLEKIEQEKLLFPDNLLRESLSQAISVLFSPSDLFVFVPISTPVLRVGTPPNDNAVDGRLTVVERREIEGIRAVQRMIQDHVGKTVRDRPLSIAVFGPPGSGKSTAVNKIIEELKADTESVPTKKLTFNLSGYTSVDQLNKAFQKIAEAGIIKDEQGRPAVPIAFFDEFDSDFNDLSRGWLKYFLSPMEDGKYGGKEGLSSAIFVFAGGTSSTFEEFCLADRSGSDESWVNFVQAKGPDFVSRLRGHINVVGIDPTGADDDSYLIRRAIAIRWLLAQQQNLTDGEQARIDGGILHALLNAQSYKHGARSVRMLLEMCTGRKHWIAMSEAPPIHQLNMQVDGKAFVNHIAGYSAKSDDE